MSHPPIPPVYVWTYLKEIPNFIISKIIRHQSSINSYGTRPPPPKKKSATRQWRASSIQRQSWPTASAAATLHPRRLPALRFDRNEGSARRPQATRDAGSSAFSETPGMKLGMSSSPDDVWCTYGGNDGLKTAEVILIPWYSYVSTVGKLETDEYIWNINGVYHKL